MENGRYLCPSYKCTGGAILLGVLQPNGRVAYTAEAVRVDNEFLDVVQQGRDPGIRFRFAGQCVKGACRYWSEDHCGLIDQIRSSEDAEHLDDNEPLPNCSVRQECRWFAEQGEVACRFCPYVIRGLDQQVTDDGPACSPPPNRTARTEVIEGTSGDGRAGEISGNDFTSRALAVHFC